jgi:hypothetical protein
MYIYICPENCQDDYKTIRTTRGRLVVLVVALITINRLVAPLGQPENFVSMVDKITLKEVSLICP